MYELYGRDPTSSNNIEALQLQEGFFISVKPVILIKPEIFHVLKQSKSILAEEF